MPGWPAGLHRPAGALRASGGRPQRFTAASQVRYTRRVTTILHAGATVPVAFWVGGPFQPGQPIAAAGPQGAGERWSVDLVQVQTPGQYGQPPLVAQQITAQETGAVTTPPPPIVAQVWLAVGGVQVYLLGQTTTGGNDDLSVACPEIGPGEAISVIWYNLPLTLSAPGWFTARGTKTVLVP